MLRYTIIIFLAITVILSSCVADDFFGLSSFGEIKEIEVANQAGQARIDSKNKAIQLDIPGGVPLDQLEVQVLTISTFAKSEVEVGDIVDLREDLTITVTAEDGTKTIWTVEAFVASSTPQLPNSDFQLWHQVNAGYFEPGEDQSSTIWGTGNPGGAILDKIATTPVEIENGNNAARLVTLDNGFVGQIAGTPITAATIYTGRFDPDNIDLNDPRAAVVLGTLFSGRPKAFKLRYQYRPGVENKDRQGNSLSYGDELDIYLFLEVRTGNKAKRLATGWFRSGEEKSEMTDLEVPLVYGPLDSSFPSELLPVDGFVPADSLEFALPTHLSFLATSSFEGASFAGAVGSELVIDDLELIYE